MWNNFLQLEVKMSGESKIDQSMDLRGVSCPLNYVKAKLKLEEMEVGQVLEILLDDGEPIVNVPRSAKEDGYKIMEIMQIEDYFKVLVKKGNIIE
jgi:tRNA 2-thiouridine synthesizing protein A